MKFKDYINERSKIAKTTLDGISVILMKDNSIILKQGNNRVVVFEDTLKRTLEFHRRVK
jgi:hypothetical protein